VIEAALMPADWVMAGHRWGGRSETHIGGGAPPRGRALAIRNAWFPLAN